MRLHESHSPAKFTRAESEARAGTALPEFHHGLHRRGPRPRAITGIVPEIEMRMTDVSIERQRVLERGARPLILRRIARNARPMST